MTIKVLPSFKNDDVSPGPYRILKTNINGLYRNDWNSETGRGFIYLYYEGYSVSFEFWTNKRKQNKTGSMYKFQTIEAAVKYINKRIDNPLYIDHSEIKLNTEQLAPWYESSTEKVKELALERGECKKYDVKIVEFL